MELVDYLANGALINILRTNSEANPPPVWVTPQSDGSYRYGFAQEQRSVGRHPAPFGVVQAGRIFLPEKGKVVEYLMTFGLSKADAELVVLRIGTEP